VPSGLWLSRLAGVDVRARGSGNIGATNVARSAGARLGVLTLILDAGKGALAAGLGGMAGGDTLAVLAGLAAFFGHILSLFVRFRGGKGVATAAGAFLVLAPAAVGGAAVIFAVVARGWRIVSLASLAAGGALPLLVAAWGYGWERALAASLVAVTLVVTHRDNLRRLASGTEEPFRMRR
jgi:glycerol-3-phosphate acyltransferase PlsY